MPLVKRSPRKRIRASQAAKIFSIGTETFVRYCRKGIYPIRLIEGPTPNSPLLVFEAEVTAKAKELGIL